MTRSEREALIDVQEGRQIISAEDPPNHQITIYKSVREKGELTRETKVIVRDNRYNLTPSQRYRFNKRATQPIIIIEKKRRE